MVDEHSNSENESEETQYSPSGKYPLCSPRFPKLIRVSKTEEGLFFTFEVFSHLRKEKNFPKCLLKHNQARILSSDYLWYYKINCVTTNCPFTCLIRPLFPNNQPSNSRSITNLLSLSDWEVLENTFVNNFCKHYIQKEPRVIRKTWKIFSEDLYGEMLRRQSLTTENLAANERLRALAFELAANPKYGGVLSNHKFSNSWLLAFRKKYWKRPKDKEE